MTNYHNLGLVRDRMLKTYILSDDPVGALDTMEIDSKGNISAAAYDASYVDQVNRCELRWL